jgi:glycosyltransferase involved in cell wall biosynthesis
MHIPPRWAGQLPHSLLVPLGKLYGHFLLCRRLRRIRARVVLVREFLTVPLLLCSAFLFHSRKKLWLLCHHNIAFASKRATHRWALRALSWLGFRFVVFEHVSLWRVVSAKGSGASVAAVPCPIRSLDVTRTRSARNTDLPVVGLIGNLRAEKSADWAVQAMADFLARVENPKPFRLVIGTPDPKFSSKWADVATTLDTSSYCDYLAALGACDVIVLPYDPSAYAYRVSGVLSEALACGCATVVPAVPGLREQVTVPQAVGACYERPEHFLDAVVSAVKLSRTPAFQTALAAQKTYRGVDGIETALRTLLCSASS